MVEEKKKMVGEKNISSDSNQYMDELAFFWLQLHNVASSTFGADDRQLSCVCFIIRYSKRISPTQICTERDDELCNNPLGFRIKLL